MTSSSFLPERIQAWSNLAAMRRNVSLRDFSTLRIGGTAELFFEPAKPEHFGALLEQLCADEVRWTLLGGGANTLFPDEDLPLVIHTGAMRRMFREEFTMRVWPGVTLPQLVRAACELGMSGMEKLVGVPGNVGGALAMNAGSADWGLWEQVEEVTMFLPGEGLVSRTPDDIKPQYRNGNLGEGVILEALLRFEEKPAALIKAEQEEFLRSKNATQPVTLTSAGCAFKNPPGDSAGRLVDAAGLKGHTIGGAQVSERHANFIVNLGDATAADVRALIQHLQCEVSARHKVALVPELVQVPSPSHAV
ncbi:MAG: UDP-N-acetylmuramate dehydrogenase, partial [Planctomycetes bacterium]|nr:UDP-N-acetylmuramate dehydrogenase [Planctomycetota bacterium]